MRNELIPKVLKEYRKQNNYSVNDVALLLHERSFDVAAKTRSQIFYPPLDITMKKILP